MISNQSTRPLLTIGMACYDDFNGVYFSVQSLRLYHPQIMDRIEILIVDNNPEEAHGRAVKDLIEQWVPEGRYLAAPEVTGTSAPRDLIFREARGEAVLCIDSHVMLAPGALEALLDYYEAHPDSRDLLQGPMLFDDGKDAATHMKPEWKQNMFGVWGRDPRGKDPSGEPFEIPMHGCGLMSCRKEAWPGFNPEFRGFGGEEGYLHEKFRQAGGRVLCLPSLRWLHRFGRPLGVPYPLNLDDRLRNYLIGRLELNQPYEDVLEHFDGKLPVASIDYILRDLGLPTMLERWFMTTNPREFELADS